MRASPSRTGGRPRPRHPRGRHRHALHGDDLLEIEHALDLIAVRATERCLGTLSFLRSLERVRDINPGINPKGYGEARKECKNRIDALALRLKAK